MRITAFTTGPDTLLDHLGPLCAFLNIPCIVTEPALFAQAHNFYPQTEWRLIEQVDLSYLATHYDALVVCGKFWAMEMGSLFELFLKKKMRFVFCPHGNSDKEALSASDVKQDIVLAYGKNMRKDHKSYNHIITVGNYRRKFYMLHQEFYDSLAKKHIFSHMTKEKKTAFYAPTWCKETELENFIKGCHNLIQTLRADYNLIIKLHPFLEERFSGAIHALKLHYENEKNVLFVDRFPAIYPILSGCTFYIGDLSSIGYDALAINLPLFFFNDDGCKTRLHSCGTPLPRSGPLCDLIEKNLDCAIYKTEREKLIDDAFAPPSLEGGKNDTITLELADLLLAVLQAE